MSKLNGYKPARQNANRHTQRGLRALEQSIREDGYVAPITVAADGEALDGSARLETVADVMDTEPIVIRHDGTRPIIAIREDIPNADTDIAKRIALRANRVAQIDLDWNPDVLLAMPDELIGSLWEPEELSALGDAWAKEQKPEAPEPQIDKAAELQAKWGTATGQLWQLGEHRLICGDCTDRATVERVMGGERAALCLTDFPYGNETDYGTYQDTQENLKNLIAQAMPIILENCDVTLVACGIANVFSYPRPAWILAWHWEHTHSGSSQWGFNNWQPVLAYGKDPYLANGMGRHQDAIPLHGISKEDISHPCPKPVETWGWFLERGSIKQGDIVYEPFSGSGTTICACESLKRKARAVEISPAYVAVALQRWADMTGKTPELIDDGKE